MSRFLAEAIERVVAERAAAFAREPSGADNRPPDGDGDGDDGDVFDECPRCHRLSLVRGYGFAFGPGCGTYEGCTADGCGYALKKPDADDES